MNRRTLPLVGFLLGLLVLFLFWPKGVFASTTIKPELSWQRSLESNDKVVHETSVGSLVVEALGLPLDVNQVVWDNGVNMPAENRSRVAPGVFWASWIQYSAPNPNEGACGSLYDLRHFQASFNLDSAVGTGRVILRSPYYLGDIIPINDNLYAYLNGHFIGQRGTSYGAGGGAGAETDGWAGAGDFGATPAGYLKAGANVLDIVAGEWCRWGGMDKLELVIESDGPPPVEPFLDLPFDTQGKSFEQQALNPTSWFDHQYPLQNVPCCTLRILQYSGIEKDLFYRSHSGYDYALQNGVELNTSVLAAAAGEASFTPYQKSGGAGNLIKIDHGNGYQTWYEHLAGEGLVISTEGTTVHVNKGQAIGKVGMTGNTNGPHIHLSVVKSDAGYPWGLVDPLGWEGDNSDPWEIYDSGGHHGSKSVNLFLARAKPKIAVIPTSGGSFSTDNLTVNVPNGAVNQQFDLSVVTGPFEKIGGQIQSVVNSFFLTTQQFTQPVTLAINYAGADLKNIIEDNLQFYFFNEQTGQWEAMASTLDKTNKIVTTSTSHFSHFAVAGTIKDLIVPTTTASISGTVGQPGWYRSKVSVALIGRDNDGGLGVHYTLLSLNENDWTKYTAPIAFNGEGKYTVYFKSVDEADNREDEKKLEFSIDTATPEARIYFDRLQNKIVVVGGDANLFSVVEKNGIFTISDLAGNNLKLATKLINQSSQSYINFLDFPNSQYYIARGIGSTAQFFQLNGDKIVILFYDGKKNQSTISIKTAGKWSTQVKTGFVLLQVFTDKGTLKWSLL